MNTKPLRQIVLRGPALPGTNEVLWELTASAPASDTNSSNFADRTHPLRTLQIDPLLIDDGQDKVFRRPHLVAMHVLAGHGEGPFASRLVEVESVIDNLFKSRTYPPNFIATPKPKKSPRLRVSHECLQLSLPASTDSRNVRAVISWKLLTGDISSMAPYWYTRSVKPLEKWEPDVPNLPVNAQFQHVIGEPVLKPGEEWPKHGVPGEIRQAINLPTFNLVAGAIELAVAQGGLPWLGTLEPNDGHQADGKIVRYPVRLVPEGLELRTRITFPGQQNKLEGWFRIEPAQDKLELVLLTERTKEAKLLEPWLKAWQHTMPATVAAEALPGVRIAADISRVPAFRWELSSAEKVPADRDDPAGGNDLSRGPKISTDFASVPVLVPSEAIRLELLSPRSSQGIDGVVNVGGGYYKLSTKNALNVCWLAKEGDGEGFNDFATNVNDKSLLLTWCSDIAVQKDNKAITKNTGNQWVLTCDNQSINSKLIGATYRCSFNERSLAAKLRGVYGLQDPKEGENNLLQAFVPLRDGWLQLPFANSPPQDLNLDTVDLTKLAARPGNVLSGFLRFGSTGDLPNVFSAFNPDAGKPLVQQAPWQVTIEAATGLRLAIELVPNSTEGEPQGSIPQRTLVLLDDPELSTRGMVWISSDAPNAQEALPRLGAGPGAFIDIPFDRLDKEATPYVEIGIGAMTISAAYESPEDVATVTRDSLILSIFTRLKSKDVRSVRWQRHPFMPLVAQLPLTRSARSAVRPLESRDLVPFVCSFSKKDNTRKFPDGDCKLLADISWSKNAPLPSLDENSDGKWTFELAPEIKQASSEGTSLDPCHLTWAAVGAPGVEIRPISGGTEWKLEAAHRFDLPLMDEAFALATLPDNMVGHEENDDAKPDNMVGHEKKDKSKAPGETALDWTELERHWQQLNRLARLSRTSHSYLADFKASGNTDKVKVKSLVGGFTWNVSKLGFTAPVQAEKLPYGFVTLGDKTPVVGNEALKGYDGRFIINGEALEPTETEGEQVIEVLGYSPSSFLDDNGYLTDACGVGIKELTALVNSNDGNWRPVQSKSLKLVGQISRNTSIRVTAGSENLGFWFRDLPLAKDGTTVNLDGVVMDAWQNGQLEGRGVEWRLTPEEPSIDDFGRGYDSFSFFGFSLQPLKLNAATFDVDDTGNPKSSLPKTVSIIARLMLGSRAESVDDGGNEVVLELVRSESENANLKLDSVKPYTPADDEKKVLSFPVLFGEKSACVEIGHLSWIEGKLNLQDVSLSFEFLGRSVTLEKTTASYDQDYKFKWEAKSTLPKDGGRFSIRTACLCLGKSAELTIKHLVQLADFRTNEAPTLQIETQETWAPSGRTCTSTFKLLGAAASVDFQADRHAFSVTENAQKRVVDGVAIRGFPASGNLSLGLLGTVGTFEDGSAQLDAFHLSGSISGQSDQKNDSLLKLQSLEFVAEHNIRGSSDRCELILHGQVKGTSAIAWPIVTSKPEPIPMPKEKGTSTIIEVNIDSSQWRKHEVCWTLQGHVMSIDTAIGLHYGNEKGSAWAVPVAARHTLTQYDNNIRAIGSPLVFDTFDTLVLAPLSVIAPSSTADETFAARYQDGYPGHPDTNVKNEGRGSLDVVLQGTFGRGFRGYVDENKLDEKQLVIASGFTGLLDFGAADRAPLLRFPALLGLEQGTLKVAIDKEPPLKQTDMKKVMVAWPDSMAQAEVGLPANAASPTSLGMAGIIESVQDAYRSDASHKGLFSAMLVEQCFPKQPLTSENADETPYFLASLVSLARALHGLKGDETIKKTYSLAWLVGQPQSQLHRGAAAVLRRVVTQKEERPIQPQLSPVLLVAGDDITKVAWPSADKEKSPIVAVRELAWSQHLRPRLALARSQDGTHQVLVLPQSRLQPVKRRVSKPFFPDASRGYLLSPSEHSVLGGPEEGWTNAARAEISGLAALSREARLPAFAGAENDGEKMAWLSQQRVPVYLADHTTINSVPIPWLDPGSARVRLPIHQEIVKVLERAFEPAPTQTENIDVTGTVQKGMKWQAILPESVVTASISDRAGVLVSRRLRLELPSKEVAAFDTEFPRFGRPAQASSSVPRTERTPRPGQLPVNTGDQLSDRQPCASRLLWSVNCRPVLGPADTVSGTTNLKIDNNQTELEWMCVVVASPNTQGVISAPWDGTLELVFELTVNASDLSITPQQAVLLMLLGEINGLVKASAMLVVDGVRLVFRTLHIKQASNWEGIFLGKYPGLGSRAKVSLKLDMRKADLATEMPGAEVREFTSLLTTPEAARAPRIECNLMIHPATDTVVSITSNHSRYALAFDGVDLPKGDLRAPVTMRMPLHVVTASQGALPLVPTTVLFTDPSYDAGLSSPPVEDSKPVYLKENSGRGDLRTILSIDRARINRWSTITLMADLRFEKRLPEHTRAVIADKVNGDIVIPQIVNGEQEAKSIPIFELVVLVQPRTGPQRQLRIAPKLLEKVSLSAGQVYELPMALLAEVNGSPAMIEPGDMLIFTATISKVEQSKPVYIVTKVENGNHVAIPWWTPDAKLEANLLRLTLTQEPVVEPPPGLYMALLRTNISADPDVCSLSVPLHAQSPLPWRVELPTARDDFRAGLMRRSATFAWPLLRPVDEIHRLSIYILKSDRTGQTYLPKQEDNEFLPFK